jgi:hypothetical protein
MIAQFFYQYFPTYPTYIQYMCSAYVCSSAEDLCLYRSLKEYLKDIFKLSF